MILRHGLHAPLLFLLLVAGNSTLALAEPDRPMLALKGKDPRLRTEQGYASVLFWRLHIEDPTGVCEGFYPGVTFGPPGSARRVASGKLTPMAPAEYFKSHFTALAIKGQWDKKGDFHVYEGLFAVQARPSPYEVFQFKLYREKEEFGSSAFALNLGEQLVNVVPGQLLYLGDIKVTVLGREQGQKQPFYHFHIAGGGTDPQQAMERDFAEMKALFPAVVAAFPAGPVMVTTSQAPVQTTIELKE